MIKHCAILLLAAASLTGCASIVNGTQQSVSVNTAPTSGATCSLTNDKGKWYVNSTPGSVTVNRSYRDLQVKCKKAGFGSGYESVPSHTKPMAFGNLIFGGVVGAGVDVVDGAAYDYPTNIYVPFGGAATHHVAARKAAATSTVAS